MVSEGGRRRGRSKRRGGDARLAGKERPEVDVVGLLRTDGGHVAEPFRGRVGQGRGGADDGEGFEAFFCARVGEGGVQRGDGKERREGAKRAPLRACRATALPSARSRLHAPAISPPFASIHCAHASASTAVSRLAATAALSPSSDAALVSVAKAEEVGMRNDSGRQAANVGAVRSAERKVRHAVVKLSERVTSNACGLDAARGGQRRERERRERETETDKGSGTGRSAKASGIALPDADDDEVDGVALAASASAVESDDDDVSEASSVAVAVAEASASTVAVTVADAADSSSPSPSSAVAAAVVVDSSPTS